MRNIVVIGSINMDVVNQVKWHPLPGETIHGLGTTYSPGGKGANQAVAAARAGASVRMLGAVGSDAFGQELLDTLRGYGIDTEWVRVKQGSSGLAFITVSQTGENNIILSAGANGAITVDDIVAAETVLEEADAVLFQNEIPWQVTSWAIKRAKALGKQVFFNPAPARAVTDNVLGSVDVLVLNETEAEVITGISVTGEGHAEAACAQLLQSGCKAVVLTLGTKGSVYMDGQGRRVVTPAFRVAAVDTTAAGDTFIGALATRLHPDGDLGEALRFASAAAAIAVTRRGAQASIPERAEVEAFLAEHGAD
jgi:ribokinase